MKQTLADTAYEKLLDMIYSLKYQSGDRLVEQQLINELEISRTPVRESNPTPWRRWSGRSLYRHICPDPYIYRKGERGYRFGSPCDRHYCRTADRIKRK